MHITSRSEHSTAIVVLAKMWTLPMPTDRTLRAQALERCIALRGTSGIWVGDREPSTELTTPVFPPPTLARGLGAQSSRQTGAEGAGAFFLAIKTPATASLL